MRSIKKFSGTFKIVACLMATMAILNSYTKIHANNPDLDFIYETIVKNHPGMYNELDPNFKENLENAYKIAQQNLLKTSEINEQQQVITNFAKSFDDIHLRIRWENNQKKEAPTEKNKQSDDCNKDKKIEINVKNFEINQLDKDVSWVTLPTFGLNKEQLNEYEKVLEQIPNLKHKKAVIFDIRGNDGGNSKYGSEIINRLFGKDYAKHQNKTKRKNVFIDWRASEFNLNFIKSNYAQEGCSKYVIDFVKGMQKSLDQNKPYYRETDSRECDFEDESDNSKDFTKQNGKQLFHDVTAQIIVAINNRNISSALLFIDELKMMGPKITLIGQKTGVDRLYNDVAFVKLPSGQGRFAYPMEVYRNRLRGDNEPYLPDFEYDTSNTEKLQKYILGVVG